MTKTLVKMLEEKLAESEINSEVLKCPHCGWKHDPEDFELKKRSSGLLKCADCGDAFVFEMSLKRIYSTFPE